MQQPMQPPVIGKPIDPRIRMPSVGDRPGFTPKKQTPTPATPTQAPR